MAACEPSSTPHNDPNREVLTVHFAELVLAYAVRANYHQPLALTCVQPWFHRSEWLYCLNVRHCVVSSIYQLHQPVEALPEALSGEISEDARYGALRELYLEAVAAEENKTRYRQAYDKLHMHSFSSTTEVVLLHQHEHELWTKNWFAICAVSVAVTVRSVTFAARSGDA